MTITIDTERQRIEITNAPDGVAISDVVKAIEETVQSVRVAGRWEFVFPYSVSLNGETVKREMMP